MKRYKVNKVENGKQTTLASFNTANEAIDYATAWSNENDTNSLIYDTVSRKRGCTFFTHKTVNGYVAMR